MSSSPFQPPRLDQRRKSDFLRELQRHAQAWISDWDIDPDDPDFGFAILEVAARFNSEVAERLDRVGDKMQKGFLDWLAIEGEAARPARMPIVFKLNNSATKSVFAKSPIRLQTDADGTPVIFETESDLRIVPGQLDIVVGVDGANDEYFLPPPGIHDLGTVEPLPVRWRLKSFAAAESNRIQLDPETGLIPGMVIEAAGDQYDITKFENGIVTIQPELKTDLDPNLDLIRKVEDFRPFTGSRNRQEHAIYLGHNDLLNIEAEATIEILSDSPIPSAIQWQYWGQLGDDDPLEWIEFETTETTSDGIKLTKKSDGKFLPLEIDGLESRWIRGYLKRVDASRPLLETDSLALRINYENDADMKCPDLDGEWLAPDAEAMANTTPLVIDQMFFPLGREPKQFDTFYLGYEEAFSKAGANAQVCFRLAESRFKMLSALRTGSLKNTILSGVAEDGRLYVLKFKSDDKTLVHLDNREPQSPSGSIGKLNPSFRLPMWSSSGDTFYIAVAAGRRVSIWKELSDPNLSDWKSHGDVGADDVGADIVGLVHLNEGGKNYLLALLDSKLFICEFRERELKWEPVETKDGVNLIDFVNISPILTDSELATGTLEDGLVGVSVPATDSASNFLYKISIKKDDSSNPAKWQGSCSLLHSDVSPTVTPSAYKAADDIVVAVALSSNARKLVAIKSDSSSHEVPLERVPEERTKILEGSIELAQAGASITFAVCLESSSDNASIATWTPFETDNQLFRTTIRQSDGVPNGGPTLVSNHFLIPTTSSEVIIAKFDLTKRKSIEAPYKTAIVLADQTNKLDEGNELALLTEEGYTFETIPAPITKLGTKKLYEFDATIIGNDVSELANSQKFDAPIVNTNKIRLHDADGDTIPGSTLLVFTDKSKKYYTVDSIDSINGSQVATLGVDIDVANPSSPPTNVQYISDFSFTAETNSANQRQIKLDEFDLESAKGSALHITFENSRADRFVIDDYNPSTFIATLDKKLPASRPAKVSYLPEISAVAKTLTQLQLIVGEQELLITPGSRIQIKTDSPKFKTYFVKTFNKGTSTVTLTEELNDADPSNLPMSVVAILPTKFDFDLIPGFELQTLLRLAPEDNNGAQKFDSSILETTRLLFPSVYPDFPETKLAFDLEPYPSLILIDKYPLPGIGGQVKFIVDGSIGDWSTQLSDTSSNPELSWEYWNGTSWSSLRPDIDETLNFKKTGAIRFTVPVDLEPTEWAGKTNHWIRARLIGGDYGREKVTIKIKEENGVTSQTVERSNEGIRPPAVLELHITYEFDDLGILPEHLISQDSGNYRNQSDANNSQEAIVEGFVPVSVLLGRMNGEFVVQGSVPSKLGDCCEPVVGSSPSSVDENGQIQATTVDNSRSILLGLTNSPNAGTVNIQLQVEERDLSRFAPLQVETLVADRFVKVLTEDTTRGLGESGILSMSLTIPPTPSKLFGFNRSWVRISTQANDEWEPVLKGVYLNAVWVSATESLTRELLGSSDGRPNLAVQLARPPILSGTLELRVREPLGEEERTELWEDDHYRVLSNVDGLPGDWVLWNQVTDPCDEDPTARVYSLDEATGTIRFGDGQHGKIPPIGRDVIVAFKYSRTATSTDGLTSPSNLITPRTPLGLVSPVETVESVIASDHAAGGAPPESDERVLKYGYSRLRHRNRAITNRDMEDLLLQTYPNIAQARAIKLSQTVKMVLVMVGQDPTPNLATIRETKQQLLKVSPLSLSEKNALLVVGPTVYRLRIDLRIRVQSLDFADAVSRTVNERIRNFFDTLTGGPSQSGWQLGDTPNENRIAAALVDIPNLLNIIHLQCKEIGDHDRIQSWTRVVGPSELVLLDQDPVRIEFETAEALV